MKAPILGITIALGALGTGAYFALGGRMPGSHHAALSGSRGRRRHGLFGSHGGEVDEAAADELRLFCDNDGDIYRQQGEPIRKNLEKKLAKGVYDHQKAIKLWGYLADTCAKKYAKEFGSGQPWHAMFSPATRRATAKEMADHFRDEYAIQHR